MTFPCCRRDNVRTEGAQGNGDGERSRVVTQQPGQINKERGPLSGLSGGIVRRKSYSGAPIIAGQTVRSAIDTFIGSSEGLTELLPISVSEVIYDSYFAQRESRKDGKGGTREDVLFFMRELEDGYGSLCLLLAQQKTQLNVNVVVKKGGQLTLEQKEKLRKACKECYTELPGYIKSNMQTRMRDLQGSCLALLERNQWYDMIRSFASWIDIPSSEEDVKVIDPSGHATDIDYTRLAEFLSFLEVKTMGKHGAQRGFLGINEATRVVEVANNTIEKRNKGERFWMSEEELLALCCLIIFLRGRLFIGSDGETCDPQAGEGDQNLNDFKDLVKTACRNKNNGKYKGYGVFGGGAYGSFDVSPSSSPTSVPFAKVFSSAPQQKLDFSSDHIHQNAFMRNRLGQALMSEYISDDGADLELETDSREETSGCCFGCCFGNCCCSCCKSSSPRGFSLEDQSTSRVLL